MVHMMTMKIMIGNDDVCVYMVLCLNNKNINTHSRNTMLRNQHSEKKLIIKETHWKTTKKRNNEN